MRKVRVLFVEPSSGLGGSSRSLASFLRRADRTKLDPIVALTSPKVSTKLFQELGVPIHRVIRKGLAGRALQSSHMAYCAELLVASLPLAVRLARLAKRLRVSIIHLNTDLSSNLAGIAAGVLADVPVISHMRSIRPLHFAERVGARFVRKLIVMSKTGVDFYREKYPGIAGKLVLVPNICELASPSGAHLRELRRIMGVSESTVLFAMFSNFVPGKGHDTFIRAAASASRQLPGAKFLLVGGVIPSGEQFHRDCHRLAEELGISDRIIFAGWRNDISELLALSTVIVDPSVLAEGFRRTIIEAAFAGKPVIATDVGPAREFLLDGQCGIVVTPNRSEELAHEMAALALDAERREMLGTRAEEMARRLFSAGEISDKLVRLYRELAKAD